MKFFKCLPINLHHQPKSAVLLQNIFWPRFRLVILVECWLVKSIQIQKSYLGSFRLTATNSIFHGRQLQLCWDRKTPISIGEFSSSWSSLVEGGEGSYLPNCQTNLVTALCTLSLLFKFINTTAHHLVRYERSSPVSCRAPRVAHCGIWSWLLWMWRCI